MSEEHSIGRVVQDIPREVQWVIVADNGSNDGTARAARERGAQVVSEPRRGYGSLKLRLVDIDLMDEMLMSSLECAPRSRNFGSSAVLVKTFRSIQSS